MRGDGRVYKRGRVWWFQYSVRGKQLREPGGKTEAEAKKKLKGRLREAAGPRFVGPDAERVPVVTLLDALLEHLRNNGRRSVDKLTSHLKAVREFFGLHRAIDITSREVERYKRARLDQHRAPATINRELEGLRQAFNHAARQTPPLFPRHLVPTFPLLPVDNVRQGFFELAEVTALLAHVSDPDLRDFIEWGWLTGMRKGQIAKLTWDMLDRSTNTWALRMPGSVEKNRTARPLGLGEHGSVRAIIERRVKARLLVTPLIFHRISKGKAGQPVKDFRLMWRLALNAAHLPAGLLFHDLRRSAVRNLVRAKVDPAVAMKVSGHKTRSMLDRYNIIGEGETAAALAQVDAYLSLQPTDRNVSALAGSEEVQKRHKTGGGSA